VAFDRSGARVVSGSWDKTVRVWDAASGAELARLDGHTDAVTSVAFDRSGARVVSASLDRTVRVWGAASGECLKVIHTLDSDYIQAIMEEDPDSFPWRALSRDLETAIEPTAGGDPIAWFPADLQCITTHPSGRAWAGAERGGKHLYYIQLEGEPQPAGRGGTKT
jgi:WD40 repeat protein